MPIQLFMLVQSALTTVMLTDLLNMLNVINAEKNKI